MKEIAKYKGCFVCGDENNIGLKAKFFFDGQKAVSEIIADEKYAGYKNIFHGGIISTMLDEIMIKALLAEDLFVVTAEMTVRFKKPVYTGDCIKFEGSKTAVKGRVFLTEGKAVNQHGEVVAEATGKYIAPKTDLSDKLKDSVEQ
ncbi:MAG: PaaI family thioesterase [candidate division Zixibacteria bacterium]|nr:PaaI family thioesterase [candidate division Zixibacteria bacterium]